MMPKKLQRLMTCGLLLMSLFIFTSAIEVVAAQLGDVTVTLQSHRYVKKDDATKFVYRVTSSTTPIDQAWVLELGDCILPEFVTDATSPFTWTEEPFRGLRFIRTAKNQSFEIWLTGQWSIGTVGVALIAGSGGNEEITIAEIDGPFCEGASIALDIVDGADIAFPEITGSGLFSADSDTLLQVTSSSSGWALSHTLDLNIPTGASAETVSRIFVLTLAPYATSDGTTDIHVGYELQINEEDFGNLPQGTYVIAITFIVSTD